MIVRKIPIAFLESPHNVLTLMYLKVDQISLHDYAYGNGYIRKLVYNVFNFKVKAEIFNPLYFEMYH